jgi:hypothetical protein
MRLSAMLIETFSSLLQFRKSPRHCGCGGCPFPAVQDVLDRSGVPPTKASAMSRSVSVPARCRVFDEWQNVRGVPVGIALDDSLSGLAGLRELRTTEHLALSFLSCQRRLGAAGDQVALFLTEGAYRCRIKGSTSAPSSAKMNGTLWDIKPEIK